MQLWIHNCRVVKPLDFNSRISSVSYLLVWTTLRCSKTSETISMQALLGSARDAYIILCGNSKAISICRRYLHVVLGSTNSWHMKFHSGRDSEIGLEPVWMPIPRRLRPKLRWVHAFSGTKGVLGFLASFVYPDRWVCTRKIHAIHAFETEPSALDVLFD